MNKVMKKSSRTNNWYLLMLNYSLPISACALF